MTSRMMALVAVSMTSLLAGVPALAQTPDFGADTSPWANDGECDDPRFTGTGMATTTLESDRMADATDCRAAFEAGAIQLIEGQAAAPAAPATPAPGTKGAQTTPPAELAEPAAPATPEAQATPAVPETQPAAAMAPVDFGDDSGQYPNDGECDDRRFIGQGMATSLSWSEVGRDASDCRPLYESGQLHLWNPMEAQAATQCASIDFGDDSGQYANDGQCDDIRFEGPAAAFTLTNEATGTDAADCTRLCAFGAVSLRDY